MEHWTTVGRYETQPHTAPHSGTPVDNDIPDGNAPNSGNDIDGQTYARNLRTIVANIRGAVYPAFIINFFDEKKGFDNDATKDLITQLIKYRANRPDSTIDYDAELNAAAAATAQGLPRGGSTLDTRLVAFDGENVGPHLQKLVLAKLGEQKSDRPDINKALNAALDDLRGRLGNALRDYPKGERDFYLAAWDRYRTNRYVGATSGDDLGNGIASGQKLAQRAADIFANDPYLYIAPNRRGPDFPWRAVVDDISAELARTGSRADVFVFKNYLNEAGYDLVRQWWLTTPP
jgi:hypothetical protein